MSRQFFGLFALLMVLIAIGLYMLGYRWSDEGAMAVGAGLIILLMSSAFVKEAGSRRK